jgi:ketosteroid isomerase-like protein
MLQREQGAPLQSALEVQVMARGTTDNLEARERRGQENLAVMRRYFDLLYSRDLDALLQLVDDDIQWLVVPTGDVISGKASLAELAANHWGASPDRTKRLLNLLATEDQACMEYTSGGTLTGEVDFRSIRSGHGRTYRQRPAATAHPSRVHHRRGGMHPAGVLALMSGTGWAIVLGIWLVAMGMDYLPLAISAQSLSRLGRWRQSSQAPICRASCGKLVRTNAGSLFRQP